MNLGAEIPAWIRVRFDVVGFHCWPSAPRHRAYLRSPHRHRFYVTVTTQVAHDERELEFHDLIDEAKSKFKIEKDWSCERMARHLANALCEQHGRAFTVVVSEDNEAEAEVTVGPKRPAVTATAAVVRGGPRVGRAQNETGAAVAPVRRRQVERA